MSKPTKSIPPGKGGGGPKKTLPPVKGQPPRKQIPPRKTPLGLPGVAAVAAVAAGTVLLTAGIVSAQAANPGRSTAVLVALALLHVGGAHGRAVLVAAARRGRPVPQPARPRTTSPPRAVTPNKRQAGVR